MVRKYDTCDKFSHYASYMTVKRCNKTATNWQSATILVTLSVQKRCKRQLDGDNVCRRQWGHCQCPAARGALSMSIVVVMWLSYVRQSNHIATLTSLSPFCQHVLLSCNWRGRQTCHTLSPSSCRLHLFCTDNVTKLSHFVRLLPFCCTFLPSCN